MILMAVPVWHGRIDNDGRFLLAEDERDRRRDYFHTLAGQRVEITVKKARTQRTIEMNAYLHAEPFPKLAEHLGYTIEEVKLVCMGECWGWHLVAGHEVPIKPHTSDMTVEESKYFVDWIIPWAMEKFGVAIMLPNEVAA